MIIEGIWLYHLMSIIAIACTIIFGIIALFPCGRRFLIQNLIIEDILYTDLKNFCSDKDSNFFLWILKYLLCTKLTPNSLLKFVKEVVEKEKDPDPEQNPEQNSDQNPVRKIKSFVFC